MIDISRQKHFFPLKNFQDVEKLFEFNIDEGNGEPNLALLSIVAGLIEHSLVVVNDKDDLVANSRPVEHRKDVYQNKPSKLIHSSSSSTNTRTNSNNHHASTQQHYHLLSSTSSEHNQPSERNSAGDSEFNEAAHVSSAEFPEISLSPQDYANLDQLTDNEIELTAEDNLTIPEIEFEIVETLYKRFADQLKNSIDFKDLDSSKVNLKIKRISDSVWEHLSNSYYKDKAHLQNIFSYLTTNKLDCFGLALAVIAGSQILNIKDIYLALSEDHAWVMFDDDQNRDKQIKSYTDKNLPIPSCALHGTCEVTWHGKANSDKRGQPVTYKNCWLYVNGYAVKCDFKSCVSALVNSINPSINSNTDSELLALLQQRLLWMLYKKQTYIPMALGTLGELENICPSPQAPLKPVELFNLGIEISRSDYNDSHVYPYTYLASYFFKSGRFKESLETWADASAVMTNYNYSRDDEEIYKEFFEVANELIPSMLKFLTQDGSEPSEFSRMPFLQDPECLGLILNFYDNICVWEEGSSTPVLHIGWAKNFVATVLKFTPQIRSKIRLVTEEEWLNEQRDGDKCLASDEEPQQCSSTYSNDQDMAFSPPLRHDVSSCQAAGSSEPSNPIDRDNNNELKHDVRVSQNAAGERPRKRLKGDNNTNTNNNTTNNNINIKLDNNIINQAPKSSRRCQSLIDQKTDQIDHHPVSNSSDASKIMKNNASGARHLATGKCIKIDDESGRLVLILKSSKIAGVRDLLHAERLNKTAIELQLTAQSQCAVRGRSNSSSYSSEFVQNLSSIVSTRSKRLHR